MTSYKQLQRDPASKDLFNNRITTLQGFHNAIKDSAFLAIDTEHVPITSERDRILHQVGLAYLPRDSPQIDPTGIIQPRLKDLYTNKKLHVLTLNISKEGQEDLIRLGGHRGMPARRPHRFGREQQVDIEDLEAIIMDFIKSHNDNNTNLVMVGFELAAEWEYLFTVFPQVMPLFSAWLDLRDIAADITSVGVIPGLVSLLQVFGFHWKDIQPGRGDRGIADNAGDDVVAIHALANALLFPENQEKLRFRQECGRIARIFTKRKGFQTPTKIRDPFTATIHVQGQSLPSSINSGMRLARQFFNYSPQFVGIMSQDLAYITFKSQNQMNQFIIAVHGLVLQTGEILSVETYSHGDGTEEGLQENEERKKKRELRERRRLEATGSEVEEGLGNLFS